MIANMLRSHRTAGPTAVVQLSSPQRRRSRRFSSAYSVHLRFRSSGPSEVDGLTLNLSIGGVLLDCPVEVPRYSAVRFVITVCGSGIRPIQLVGEGEVVRVERSGSGNRFAVAIKCKAPITQVEPYVPGAVG